MSFLLRRNVPRAKAFWRDLDGTYPRPAENPIQKPWGIWGSNAGAVRLNSSNNIELDAVPQVTGNLGGVSFEHSCFTDCWGFDFALKANVGGTLAVPFMAFPTSSWAKVSPDMNNLVKIEWQYRSAIVGSHQLRVLKYTNPLANGDPQFGTTFTQNMFDGNWHDHRVLIDGDELVRIYIDGVAYLQGFLDSTLKLSPGKRAVNFQNGTGANNIQMANFKLYDQATPLGIYNNSWASIFSDNFNRANGAVANGWTQLGTNASIVSNSWATTGTTDGNRAIIRNSGITNGIQRIEATIGGSSAPNNTADAGLVLCCNSAGTQGLSLNVFGNALYISRFSSVLSGSSITFNDLAQIPSGITISSGDVLAFCLKNGVAWAEINGQKVLTTTNNANAVVPASNSWMGARVHRASFNNSASWNDVNLMQAA